MRLDKTLWKRFMVLCLFVLSVGFVGGCEFSCEADADNGGITADADIEED